MRKRYLLVPTIIRVACSELDVDVEELATVQRSGSVGVARRAICLLARRRTPASFMEIADYMGKSNHTTSVNHFQRGEREYAENEPFAEFVDRVEKLADALENATA